jgi:hypothetical protein
LTIDAVIGGEDAGVNVSFMRILRILRLVRVMRLVRVVRYISELRTIIASIANSMKSLIFTMILISFLIYIMSVFLTQLVTEQLRKDDTDPVARENLELYFGSVPMSILVLFQMFTGGVDWDVPARPLYEDVSPILAVVVSFYMAFCLFAMLNVITGVFVESALESDAEEKDATMVSRLLEFLSGCPSASEGVLTWEEFQERLGDPAMICYFQSVDLDPNEASSLFKLCDADGNGTVDPEEFVMGCLRLRGGAKAIDLATLMYENRRWFRHFENKMKRIERILLAASGLYEAGIGTSNGLSQMGHEIQSRSESKNGETQGAAERQSAALAQVSPGSSTYDSATVVAQGSQTQVQDPRGAVAGPAGD